MTYEDVENARKQYLSRMKKQAFVGFAITIGFLIAVFLSRGTIMGDMTFVALFLMPFILAGIALVALFFNRKLRNNYRKAYKEYFIERNLRTVFSELEYHHELGLPSSFLRATGMINTGNRYSSNDYIRAKYKDVAFCQADVHIENEYTDSDGNTHYTTIFRGRFMVFEFPKEFSFKLALIGKKFAAFKFPGKDKVTGRKLEKFSTESSTFNKLLRAYAEDGFEAFYLLDPKTIATLEDITVKHSSGIAFLFVNNQLIIGLGNGRDSFEPPHPFRPIDEAKENAKVISDIKIITDFVDSLSLNRKLFK